MAFGISLVQPAKTLTRISLIAIDIQLIRAGSCLDAFIVLDGFDPARPTTTSFRFRPAAVRRQYLSQPNDPRCELNVHEGNVRAKKERAGLICGFNDLLDSFCELLCLFDLTDTVVSLQQAVEVRQDLAIDVVRP